MNKCFLLNPENNLAQIRLVVFEKNANNAHFKGELGELEFYFRNIPLHQQKFLVVSFLSNSPWLPRNLRNRLK